MKQFPGKRLPASTLILVTGSGIGRADFEDGLRAWKTGPRLIGASWTEAVRAAFALGGKASGGVWVLSEEVWSQEVSLGPAQIAGLTLEQLGRALSFEVEPFSGIPLTESAVGFHQRDHGVFEVVEMSRIDRDAIGRLAKEAGGKLAGITHPGTVPADEEALHSWLAHWPARLDEGALPLIRPPAPAPSPNRFLITGLLLEAAALFLLFFHAGWTTMQRKNLERRNAELNAANRAIEDEIKQVAAPKKELAALEKQEVLRQRVAVRRCALLAVLDGLAIARQEDVVVHGIQAGDASNLIVSGLSLEASAVDEMSIILTQNLRATGWIAQPRHKTGMKTLPSGGPWEFSLAVTHEEAAALKQAQPDQFE
jgi:hypothetical protein